VDVAALPTDPAQALERLGELIRVTAPPAGVEEIAEQGVLLCARAAGATAALLLLSEAPDGASCSVAARHGAGAGALESLGRRAIAEGTALVERRDAAGGLAQPLPGAGGAMGALVLERAAVWDPAGHAFAHGAASVLAAAVAAARALAASRVQGEILAQRNVEIEIVREMLERLPALGGEREMLRGALDLVLTRLGLQAGWILWGDATGAKLELAASCGLPPGFAEQAGGEQGGACLCHDVFASGKLRVARNTAECPRLAQLAPGAAPLGHACVPLRFERDVRGVLNVAEPPGRVFTAHELQFLETIGHELTLAVGKARAEQAEKHRHAEALEALLQLRRAQEGMVRAERLAAVGTLASSLAHEVRNPLNSIQLQLVLLERRVTRMGANAPPELSGLIETAKREIARLDALVEEFLSLSSVDRLTPSETEATPIVGEVAALMGPLAREAGIRVEQHVAPDLPVLRVDREKVKQVLINLVRNAIEAMPGGGQLDLRVERAAAGVTIHVEDSGTGIEPGLDVFDFFMTTKRGGTGLGLPIARRIVEAHGGSLTYESRLGRGTRFSVALPARAAAGRDAEPAR
jgi:signal transduction histidine kinase